MFFESNNLLNTIKEFVKQNSEQDDIHGFPHIIRVYDLCQKIGENLDANLKILSTAALLHDIGRKNQNVNLNHADISAEIARDYLYSLGDHYSNKEIEKILHCIRAHSFSNKLPPNSLEAKILSDVDKLDALGAIGLYRTIGFTIKKEGGLKEIIKHLEDKILDLPNLIYLDISKRMAEKRKKIIYEFYEEVITESKLLNPF
jgi:uncharacterized protein